MDMEHHTQFQMIFLEMVTFHVVCFFPQSWWLLPSSQVGTSLPLKPSWRRYREVPLRWKRRENSQRDPASVETSTTSQGRDSGCHNLKTKMWYGFQASTYFPKLWKVEFRDFYSRIVEKHYWHCLFAFFSQILIVHVSKWELNEISNIYGF